MSRPRAGRCWISLSCRPFRGSGTNGTLTTAEALQLRQQVIDAQDRANSATRIAVDTQAKRAALDKNARLLLWVGIAMGVAAVGWVIAKALMTYFATQAPIPSLTAFPTSPAYLLAFGAMMFIQWSVLLEWPWLPWLTAAESVLVLGLMAWHMEKKNATQIASTPPTKGTP